ncbi:MAG: ATP-binding protein [Rhizonema sp. PD37]|nr:ATP-binding protein [Rhizonema sp. PD37]
MLKELHLQQVGPSEHFNIEFASRLNLFTGDNGLGKSFLLDITWWVLTNNWVEQAAYAQRGRDKHPQITALVNNVQGEINREYQSLFDFSSQQWCNLHSSSVEEISPTGREQNHHAVSSVVIYVRVDGGFSVYNPVRKRDNA